MERHMTWNVSERALAKKKKKQNKYNEEIYEENVNWEKDMDIIEKED